MEAWCLGVVNIEDWVVTQWTGRGLHAWDLIMRVSLCCVVTGVVSDAGGGEGVVMPELVMCCCLL